MQSVKPLFTITPVPIALHAPGATTATKEPHSEKKEWQIPKLLFKCKDVTHPGAVKYFANSNTETLLREAVVGVLECLYTFDTAPNTQRSITMILRPMDGIAYTTSSDLDTDHKEIHFALQHISNTPNHLVAAEILGVIRHEMVHCFQYNAHDTCPGGLIEGIADWVRLQAGFCPPHWSRGGSKWDDGYQNTAYFLEWLEEKYGKGTVMAVNAALAKGRYKEEMWQELCGGYRVDELWEEYKKAYNIGQPSKPVESCT